jgi:ABC-2 type transport system ATP-binding protein
MIDANKLIISAKGLGKNYGSFSAVKDLNFSVNNGEIFGLLGPNGAGKTTIILMLLGLTEPSSGSCRVFGYDPVKKPLDVKKLCGYLPERFGFYENLTAGSNLRYIANLNSLSGSKAENLIDEALNEVGLKKQKNMKVSQFSRGMKQRLGIAQAFFKKPELVVLDEPTQGIDPRGIEDILKLFKKLNREEGLTILLSSHNMQQVQETCTSFGIMSKGKLMKKGTVKLLEAEGSNWTIDVEAHGLTDKIINNLGTVEFVKQIHRDGDTLVIQCTKDIRSEISENLIKNGAHLTKIGLREHTILEVYRKYSEEEI